MNTPAEYTVGGISQRHDLRELMEEFRDEVKAMHGRVMDIGCGPGNGTKDIILPHLPDDAVIVGIDVSSDMIKYAEEHNDEERLSFLQLNIETTELPTNLIERFDNMVSCHCFNWCQNTKLMSNNIYKLLRPGAAGLILFNTYHPAFDIYLEYEKNSKYSVYMQNAPNCVPAQYGHPHPEELMKSDLEEAGFEVLHCTKRLNPFVFKNVNCYLDLFMAISPFFTQMPEDLQRECRNDMKKAIIEKHSINENYADSSECPIEVKRALVVVYFRKPKK